LVARLQAIIPETFVDAFVHGDVLQVLLIAILSGLAVSRMGAVGLKIAEVVGLSGKVFFGIIRIVVRAAPIGAFGAMAFAVGRYNSSSLASLAKLIAGKKLTEFVFCRLGSIKVGELLADHTLLKPEFSQS
jgi:aerobic C4-dicarboxylate transport protein